jgi:hypothetical protein
MYGTGIGANESSEHTPGWTEDSSWRHASVPWKRRARLLIFFILSSSGAYSTPLIRAEGARIRTDRVIYASPTCIGFDNKLREWSFPCFMEQKFEFFLYTRTVEGCNDLRKHKPQEALAQCSIWNTRNSGDNATIVRYAFV